MKDEIIKKAFDRVRPSEELVSSVLNFKQETVRTKKKISARHIIGTAAAVCAVLAFGVTAAAVTGLIDFNAVFGMYATVNDSELGDALFGTVTDFSYKVSDDDYQISIKGVTGTDGDIIAVAELTRKDGTPVADHFVNPLPADEIGLDNFRSGIHTTDFEFFTGGYGSYINESGNIEIVTEFSGNKTSEAKTVTVDGTNFYPLDAYNDFLRENNVYNMDHENFTGYVKRESTYENIIPADVDDSGIIVLELEWEYSFVFSPSDKARQTKFLDDPEENFVFCQGIFGTHPKEDGGRYSGEDDLLLVYENSADVTYIEAGSTGARVDFVYPENEYEKTIEYSVHAFYNSDIYIILKDGRHMKALTENGSASRSGDMTEWSYKLVYADEDWGVKYIDADDISAISINGTVYEFE
ncbi:MAG: hypothetical protein NC120_11300 [Ruminococcus sp.]|nr:hypothetical protein [Ruminococcus sp.]